MLIAAEDRAGGLGAPAGEPGEAVGAVPDQGEIVRDRGGRDAELGSDRRFIDVPGVAAVELHDAGVTDALAEVLVGGADDGALDAGIGGGHRGAGREGVVGFELHLGPDRDAEGAQGVLDQGELSQERRFDSGAGLVAGPEIVSKRFDDVIGGDTHMGGALLEELQDGADDAAGGAHVNPIGVEVFRHREVVTEQLIGPVDEMHLHGERPSRDQGSGAPPDRTYEPGTGAPVRGTARRRRPVRCFPCGSGCTFRSSAC